MRLVEFASAADQLALWKLISDSVWRNINAQAQQQAKMAAQQKRVVKPKGKVASKVKIPKAPAPKPLPQPKPLYPAKPKPVIPTINKRQSVQLGPKTPASSTEKIDGRVVARGIATMNAPANPRVT